MGDGVRALERRRTGGDPVTQIQNRHVALLLSSYAIFPALCPFFPFWAPILFPIILFFLYSSPGHSALHPPQSWPLGMPCLQVG